MAKSHDRLFFRVGRVRDRIHRGLSLALKEAGQGELGPSHADIIAVLASRPEATVQELAQYIDRDKSTLTVLIAKLEKLKLIARHPDPGDGRVTRLTLTERSRALLPEMRDISRRLRKRAYHGISMEERTLLNDLLDRIHANLEDPPTP